jgi:plastocyanin
MTDDMRFHPEEVIIVPGDTIVWINDGRMPHTATDKPGTAAMDEHNILPPGAEPFDSGLLQSGERFEHVFTVSGDYTYLCFLHEGLGMIGTVTVRTDR